jgi:hypothetical protein
LQHGDIVVISNEEPRSIARSMKERYLEYVAREGFHHMPANVTSDEDTTDVG